MSIGASVFALLLSSVTPAATPSQSLSAGERARLGQQVCRARVGTDLALVHPIDATYAEVTCQPHASQLGLPQVLRARCARHAARWNCDQGVQLLALANGDRYVFIELTGDARPATALSIVKYVTTLGWFQGYRLPDLVSGTCRVVRGPTGEWLLKCGYATVYVAEDPDPAGGTRLRVFDVNVTVS